MRDLAKGLLAPIILFFLLFLVGWGVIDQSTDTAAILDRSVTAAESAADSAANDPFADDASGPADGQIETYLTDIADGLFQWIMIVTAAGALCTIIWYLLAAHRQKRVVGPAGQSTAFVHWVASLFLYLAICAGAYFLVIEPLGVDEFMDDSMFWAFVGASAIAGGFVYWLATGLAASPVMGPSVPFAARRVRS